MVWCRKRNGGSNNVTKGRARMYCHCQRDSVYIISKWMRDMCVVLFVKLFVNWNAFFFATTVAIAIIVVICRCCYFTLFYFHNFCRFCFSSIMIRHHTIMRTTRTRLYHIRWMKVKMACLHFIADILNADLKPTTNRKRKLMKLEMEEKNAQRKAKTVQNHLNKRLW